MCEQKQTKKSQKDADVNIHCSINVTLQLIFSIYQNTSGFELVERHVSLAQVNAVIVYKARTPPLHLHNHLHNHRSRILLKLRDLQIDHYFTITSKRLSMRPVCY